MRRRTSRSASSAIAPTASGAAISANRKPRSGDATRLAQNHARTAPSMKNSPCATLTMRITPKTSDRPSAVSARTNAVTVPSSNARKRCGPKLMGSGPRMRRSERLLRVVRLGVVQAVFDLRAVHDLELAALDLGDVLVAVALVQLAVELLRALRVPRSFGEVGHRFERLDELLVVGRRRILVAALLDRLLDDMERLPAAEHVRERRHVLRVRSARARVVYADELAVVLRVRGRASIGVARERFPEVRAVEELEARACDVDPFERIDEAEDLRALLAEMLAHRLHERQHARPDHHVVQHFGVRRHAREVLGERALGWRDRQLLEHRAAALRYRLAEKVAVIVAEGVVGVDHRDFLAELVDNPRGHRRDLRAHCGDAGLEDGAVELARGDVVALAHHEVRDLQLARARRRGDHDVREQRPINEVDLVLLAELLDDLGSSLRVGAVILGDDLHRPSGDAAFLVHELYCCGGPAPGPAPPR